MYRHRCKNRCGEREENEQTDQMVTMGQRTTENERALSDGASDGVDVLFFRAVDLLRAFFPHAVACQFIAIVLDMRCENACLGPVECTRTADLAGKLCERVLLCWCFCTLARARQEVP